MIIITLQNKETYGIVELGPDGSAYDRTAHLAKEQGICLLMLNMA